MWHVFLIRTFSGLTQQSVDVLILVLASKAQRSSYTMSRPGDSLTAGSKRLLDFATAYNVTISAVGEALGGTSVTSSCQFESLSQFLLCVCGKFVKAARSYLLKESAEQMLVLIDSGCFMHLWLFEVASPTVTFNI